MGLFGRHVLKFDFVSVNILRCLWVCVLLHKCVIMGTLLAWVLREIGS